jgi:hypothetical protein
MESIQSPSSIQFLPLLYKKIYMYIPPINEKNLYTHLYLLLYLYFILDKIITKYNYNHYV